MAECILCGDYETEHNPPELGHRCRVRNYYGPGLNDYVLCECPGYEPIEEASA
jgi:hypothetical protein